MQLGDLGGKDDGMDAWEEAFGVAPPPTAAAPAESIRSGRPAVGAGAAGPGVSGGEGGDELLEGLNPAQAEAARHTGGPLLILAGAGSGKTRVITRRIGWLIRERRAAPWGVLAITFTNKAAAEMRERVGRLDVPSGAWISTFHSSCARILRRDIEHLKPFTRDFTIYDTDDRNRLIRDLIKEAGYDTTRFRPAAVGGWISQRKNGQRDDREGFDDGGIEAEVFERVMAAYDKAMARNNALDFDDLLLKVLELFERFPGVRDAYAQRFEQVLVDEYQDTNRVQYLLMRHLAGFHGNLTVCGDPDQSIYGWRGADVRNILDFESDFPGAHVVRLEQNYRSTKNILRAAQGLIRHNTQRKEKDLWSDGEEGELIGCLECGDEDDEAREIALQIRSLVDGGRRHDEVAIFYRVNFMQRALERALRLSSIPYQIVAGTEFFQRREIKDVVAYLRLMVNPSDDEAFRRVVNVPQRGVGDRSLELLSAWARQRGVPLLEAAGSEEARSTIRGRAKNGLAAFSGLFELLSSYRDGPAAEALKAVLDETEYHDWLGRSSDGDEVDRQANVDELVANAETYDRTVTEPEPATDPAATDQATGPAEALGGLRGFLQDIALVSDADGFEDEQPRVRLMTLHTAKGLEFPFVFMAGMEEELLPHARAIAEGLGEGDGEGDGIEEERRLAYVGITRARERLFLTHASTRRHFGQEQYCRPSRFLEEIPSELLAGAAWSDEGDEADTLGEYAPGSSKGGSDLAEGMLVEHEHFGRGVIESLLGSGVNARATVRFEYHGRKQLLLQYARLQALPRGGR